MRIIRYDELGAGAKYELDPARRVAIDCNTAPEPWICQDAGMRLAKEKFRDVAVVDLERRKSDCEP
jgi:hypothetical protein